MDEALWQAIVNCASAFDGTHFYGVITTGIVCRPSCRSRTPRRESVRIFHSVDEAIAAGFRPCKRCRPDNHALGPEHALVQAAKAIIDHRYQDALTLDVLARELSISPYHLHRVFKRLTGVTPADCLLDKRIRVAKTALRTNHGRTITAIALAVGFRSASHFSTAFQRETGYSPRDYRDGQDDCEVAKELTR